MSSRTESFIVRPWAGPWRKGFASLLFVSPPLPLRLPPVAPSSLPRTISPLPTCYGPRLLNLAQGLGITPDPGTLFSSSGLCPPLRLVPSTTLGRIPYPSASWTWPRFVLTTPDVVTMSQWDSLRACRACDSSLCLVARLPLPRRAGRYPLWHEKMGEILDGIQLHPIW